MHRQRFCSRSGFPRLFLLYTACLLYFHVSSVEEFFYIPTDISSAIEDELKRRCIAVMEEISYEIGLIETRIVNYFSDVKFKTSQIGISGPLSTKQCLDPDTCAQKICVNALFSIKRKIWEILGPGDISNEHFLRSGSPIYGIS